MSSDNPRGVQRKSVEPDNQQERPARESVTESSETIRRTSEVFRMKIWSELHGDMQGLRVRLATKPGNNERNSLSGKPQLAQERSDSLHYNRLISVEPSGACGSARVTPREVFVTP